MKREVCPPDSESEFPSPALVVAILTSVALLGVVLWLAVLKLERPDPRVKQLESQLVEAKAARDVEYWSHQCGIEKQREHCECAEDRRQQALESLKHSAYDVSGNFIGCSGLNVTDTGEISIDSTCPIYGATTRHVLVDRKQVWP